MFLSLVSRLMSPWDIRDYQLEKSHIDGSNQDLCFTDFKNSNTDCP